jgi:hypothetical protein
MKLKKGLQALRGYSIHLNEQKSSSQHMSRIQCLLRYWRVSVWVGISGDQFLEPVVLPNRLTGAVYRRFLVNDLPVTLGTFAFSSATVHVVPHVRQHLNQTFGQQWIGRGDLVSWPALSSDLNHLDFWLWGHLKALAYSVPINDVEVLRQRVENASQEI